MGQQDSMYAFQLELLLELLLELHLELPCFSLVREAAAPYEDATIERYPCVFFGANI